MGDKERLFDPRGECGCRFEEGLQGDTGVNYFSPSTIFLGRIMEATRF